MTDESNRRSRGARRTCTGIIAGFLCCLSVPADAEREKGAIPSALESERSSSPVLAAGERREVDKARDMVEWVDKAEAALRRNNGSARSDLTSALERIRKGGPEADLGSLLGAVGLALMEAGSFDEAEDCLAESIALAEKHGRASDLAVSLNNYGNLLTARKRYDRALSNYLRSAGIAESLGNHLLSGKAWLNAVRVSSRAEAAGADKAWIDQAARELERAPDSPEKRLVLAAMGYQLQKAARFENTGPETARRAYDILLMALESAQAANDELAMSLALGHMSALYADAGRTEEAQSLIRRAAFLAQNLQRPELVYRWQWQEAKLHRMQGNREAALAAYERAVQTLEPIRHNLLRTYWLSGQSFREAVGDLYLERADLLLEAGNTEKTIPLDRLMDARDTVEQFKSAEIQDYFRDDCVLAFQEKSSGIDRIEPQTAVLYPIVLADRTELLISLPSGMKEIRVPKGKDEVTRITRQLRKLLEKRTTREYLPYARDLYDILIQPLEPHLARERISTLVFVPDDPLRTIPLAALHDGTGFLVEKYAVATSPGLTLVDPHPFERHDVKVLLAGLTEGVQGFPPLPHVDEEIQGISRLYESTILKNRDFRKRAVEERLTETPFRVVHLASHGQFKNDNRHSFLLSYDGKISLDDLNRTLQIGKYREEPVDLLTLSACQTAAGDDQAALGLAGIAVKAGARSALASLWFINDVASAILVEAFYKNLRNVGYSKAEALRQAQIEILKDGRFSHPGYWAPFLLIGNWL
jgi:CHAT domain-containing protein/Tfp pilus assembly protein PilF